MYLLLLGLFAPGICFGAGPPPVINVQPVSQSVLLNDSVTFSVAVSSSTTLSYQWQKNGANISGATVSNYTIVNVRTNDQATYRVKVTNSGGSLTSSNAALTVLVPPTITMQPQSQAIAVGQNGTFSVVATGTAPLSYQWLLEGTNLPNMTDSFLTISNAQGNNAGLYSVVVSNPFGTATSTIASLVVSPPGTYVVINTNDSGPGSLRQALTDAALATGAKTIAFNITSSNSSGAYTISLSSALPGLTDNTTVDGYTQPGASRNTLTNGNNAVIKIRLMGTAAAGEGLTIGNPGCAIYGLAIVNFPGNGIRLSSFGNAVIQGNFIGLDPDGLTARGNSGLGIRSTVFGATIGGPAPWQRNVISANLGGGISLQNSPGNIVQGNYIGSDASGTRARGNSGIALELTNPNSTGNLIGGANIGEGNLIAAATGNGSNNHGIYIYNASNNRIQGNFIGTDFTGTNALGNLGCGIHMTNAPSDNLIGGTDVGAGNTIAYNSRAGVWIGAGTNNGVYGNSVFANGGLGIDLGFAGVQANDISDADSGPNNLQNFPVLNTATNEGGFLRITGSLTSSANQNYRLEFFTSPTSGSFTNAQGKSFIGATNISLSNTSFADFTVSFPCGVNSDSVVTATASDPANNTSEFSSGLAVIFSGPPTIITQPQSVNAAVGSIAALAVAAHSMSPLTYQWYFRGSVLANATNASLVFNTLTPANEGDYSLVIGNAAGSITSVTATVTVLLPPEITTEPISQSAGTGQDVAFSVAATGTGPLTYQWSFNGAPLSGANSPALLLTNVRETNSGNYMVTVSNIVGTATGSAALTVTNIPAKLSLPTLGAAPPNGFEFRLSMPVGSTYVILASTNLQDWSPISTNVALTRSFIFRDADSGNYPMRFYKALVE